jgi:hypothetical protein
MNARELHGVLLVWPNARQRTFEAAVLKPSASLDI